MCELAENSIKFEDTSIIPHRMFSVNDVDPTPRQSFYKPAKIAAQIDGKKFLSSDAALFQ
jgi:hypothetical protein